MADEETHAMIDLGGLWETTSRKGVTYLQGQFTPRSQILIFKNERRSKQTDPTHIMKLALRQRRDSDAKPAESHNDPAPF